MLIIVGTHNAEIEQPTSDRKTAGSNPSSSTHVLKYQYSNLVLDAIPDAVPDPNWYQHKLGHDAVPSTNWYQVRVTVLD